jgi:membrane-bound metal-dependent hydrolase YbcI (DUF457 family)
MMVLTHGMSGYVCGRVAMPALRRVSPLSPRAMSWAFALGAMMPDGDILSRVLLGQGAYFSGAWYGHRQASHSIVGTFLLAGLVAVLGVAAWLKRGEVGRRGLLWSGLLWTWGCLWCGGLLHLVGDLPTPGMSLPLFWPVPGRFGSWGHIGWFTPYLWWMFLTAVLAAACLRWIGARLVAKGWLRSGIYVAGAAWVFYATAAARWIEYLAISRYETATLFAAQQRELLPEPLASFSSVWVRALWRWMVD